MSPTFLSLIKLWLAFLAHFFPWNPYSAVAVLCRNVSPKFNQNVPLSVNATESKIQNSTVDEQTEVQCQNLVPPPCFPLLFGKLRKGIHDSLETTVVDTSKKIANCCDFLKLISMPSSKFDWNPEVRCILKACRGKI